MVRGHGVVMIEASLVYTMVMWRCSGCKEQKPCVLRHIVEHHSDCNVTYVPVRRTGHGLVDALPNGTNFPLIRDSTVQQSC